MSDPRLDRMRGTIPGLVSDVLQPRLGTIVPQLPVGKQPFERIRDR